VLLTGDEIARDLACTYSVTHPNLRSLPDPPLARPAALATVPHHFPTIDLQFGLGWSQYPRPITMQRGEMQNMVNSFNSLATHKVELWKDD
jgi:hypothetical protein